MAALAPVVDAIDQVPEPLRSFYEHKDGKFVLSVSGAIPGFVPASELVVANNKVTEFRDTNIALVKERDTLKTLEGFGSLGVDLETAKAAVTAHKALKDKGVNTPDDLDTKIAAAVSAAVKPLNDALTAASQTAKEQRERADRSTMQTAIGAVFLKQGGKVGATDYIVGQAESVFEVVNGEVRAKSNQFSGERPGEALSIEEWMIGATKKHDFAFGPSGGGGANPGNPGSGGGNPSRANQKVYRNPTPQQLGDPKIAAEIRSGHARFEHDEQ